MANTDVDVDLLVVGSGAGGLSAAVFGAAAGLSTLVLEKTEWLGGTTAYSAGTAWIPGHRHQADSAADREAARRYLDTLVGDRAPVELRESLLTHGPAAIDQLDRLGVGFRHTVSAVDYHPEIEGCGVGRALEPEPFDGRRLGAERFRRVRPPVPEFALFGGSLMLRRAEVDELLAIFGGSPRAVGLALRRGARWALDRLRYPRGTRLTMGNALVAGLYHQLVRRSGDVWFGARAVSLIVDDSGRVAGAVVSREGGTVRVGARRGVVLAGGGFAANPALRARHLPEPTAEFTCAAEGATGDFLTLAGSAGGALSAPVVGAAPGARSARRDDNAFWFPSSVGRRRNGSLAVFPHIWDRAKPGIIAVDAAGHRFVDESVSYHRFVRAMYATSTVPAWLVLDARTLSRYGLGLIRPRLPAPLLRHYLRTGYLRRGATIGELAAAIGVDPAGLEQTIRAVNDAARLGVPQLPHPNPNLGTIEDSPFSAIAVVPTPLATSLGLRINPAAQVLDAADQPVPGLYACGNDAQSITASEYPGAGCQIGAALTFAYLAARDASRAHRSGRD
ncbi:FAD-dependent oxidoreductase [Cryptosporangium minutisporangium]|uniref:FAD-dependent oxidoreductase n=1 Tax=Cryptosporangium minutisporangium TaxID=113569 RepID=A0ABP6STW2_9ACTN